MMTDDMISFYSAYADDPAYKGIRGDDTILDNYEWTGNETVLDIGCGGGFDAKALSGKCRKVFAIDVQESMIKYANENNYAPNIEYVCGDFINSKLSPETFDVVLCNWMTFHFKNKVELFEKVRACLKPGGVLLLSDTWVYDEKVLLGEWYFEPVVNYMEMLNRVFGNVIHYPTKPQSDIFYRINFKAIK